MRELSGAPTTHLYIVSHSFLCVKDLILCMYSDYINHFNPSIITCLLPGRNPAPEQIHITSLPPSIPTDQEPEQAEGQGEDVYPVHNVFFLRTHHIFMKYMKPFSQTHSATWSATGSRYSVVTTKHKSAPCRGKWSISSSFPLKAEQTVDFYRIINSSLFNQDSNFAFPFQALTTCLQIDFSTNLCTRELIWVLWFFLFCIFFQLKYGDH